MLFVPYTAIIKKYLLLPLFASMICFSETGGERIQLNQFGFYPSAPKVAW